MMSTSGRSGRTNEMPYVPLVGMPGSVGGALRVNAGGRTAEIGQFVVSVDILDSQGNVLIRERDGVIRVSAVQRARMRNARIH